MSLPYPLPRAAAPTGDAAVIGVAELDRRLKRAVEGATGEAWVEGEVSGARPAASGHLYFTLKDEHEDAAVDCVMYRSASVVARKLVVDGARVQLRGKATVWAPRGRLQFVVEQARVSGRGALLEALEALKLKLAAEGLFAPERKRRLPAEARVIGVVTSASGAAIHDIATVAFRRGGARILLAPALVQGQGAAASISRALDLLEAAAATTPIDVVIVGRGGGSADDLSAFNDEALARRIAACRIPVVSAVGHEIDVTIADLVADARAATPSQAAELLVPDAHARALALAQLRTRLLRAQAARAREDRSALRDLVARFASFRDVVAERSQEVDDARARMHAAALRAATRRRAEIERLHRRLSARHPRAVVADARASLLPLVVRLGGAERRGVATARRGLATLAAGLDAMSPLAVLGRGYAIATRADGSAARDASALEIGEPLRIRVARGSVDARVEAVHEERSAK